MVLQLATAYLPPLDFFAAAVKAGRFHIDTRETYRKQTFRNRALIVTSQGILTLSLPCEKPFGNRTPTGEVLLCEREKWQRLHWRSIVTAYNKSPYFLYYRDELEKFYTRPFGEIDGKALRLADFNAALIDFFIGKLRLPVERVTEEPEASASGKFPPPSDFSPKREAEFCFPPYLQTFPCQAPLGHLSILDLLFNLGPEAGSILTAARPA